MSEPRWYKVVEERNGIGQSRYRVAVPRRGARWFRYRWRAELWALRQARQRAKEQWVEVEE